MNALSIVEVTGKKQRIHSAIELALEDWPVVAELPNILLMTQQQYEYIKKSGELGGKHSWMGAKPEDRVYISRYNAMEVRIYEEKTVV